MDELIVRETPKRRPFTFLAGGCLVVLFLLLIGTAVVLGYRQKTSKGSADLTPTAVPTPHILVHEPADPRAIVHEDFSSNLHDWGLYYHNGKIEIINGKLILQSNAKYAGVIGTSEIFSPAGETYYLQADFTTDKDQTPPYGLIFGLNKSLGTYYVFEIWPRNQEFRLMKSNKGNWRELIPFSRHAISSYPEATTLSVYFNEGNMELYINGGLADTYSDADFFHSDEVGVFAGGGDYRLVVDDFFIYPEQ